MTTHDPSSHFDALVRHSAEIITAIDEDQTITYHSPSADQLLGYDEEALIGDNVLECIHPDDRATVLDAFQELEGAETTPLQFRFRHAEGLWVPLDAAISSPADSDIAEYVINSREIFDRDRFDPADERISKRMSDGVLSLDEEWRITRLNDQATELLDRDAENLLGTDFWDAFPEATDTAFHQFFHEAIDTQESVAFETYYEPLNTTFEIRAYPSENGLTMYFRDVSEQRRLANELHDSADALHELYELASNTELSFEQKRSRVLDLGRQRLGLPYAFVSRITEDTQRIVDAKGNHELLQPGETCPIEESYCRKTIGSEGLLAIFDAAEGGFDADPAYDRFQLGSYIGGKLVVGEDLYGTMCFAGTAARDREFTDSERAFVEIASRWLSYELEQRQYRTELERQNDRLERFASVLSHDLRNPLSIVEGRLELEREQRDSENLQTAADALDRAFGLIDEVLEFARMGDEVTDGEPVVLATVARDAWEMVENGEIDLVIEDESERVVADPDRLQRLFENLFRNSVEHAGDELTQIRVGSTPDGFYVADDGCGIPDEQREEVFESGFTTSREGTGFGLSIVTQIADAHGWTVSLEPASDGGARFEFSGTSAAT